MKKLLYTLMVTLIFIGCGSNTNESKSLSDDDKMKLVEKRILQKRFQKGGGMLKADAFDVQNIKKLGDSTFQANISFHNPMVDMEIRVTDYYIFTADLDSILLDSTIKLQSKVEGDWVDMGW